MIGLSSLEASVVSALDEAALVRDLVEMVRVPSITGSDAESDLQMRSAAQLERLGLDVDTWKLDLESLRADDRFPGTEAPRSEGYGVVGVTPGGGVPAMVLQGHVDVVPTGDLRQWEGADPFGGDIRGGVVCGRGACDMKAGVAVNAAVVRTLRTTGVRLDRPLAVHTVVSEEDGGLGAFATLVRGHRGEVAVITEPTSGRIVTANAGALTFRIEVAGAAAHGATRTEGFSAFEAFLPVYRALRKLETARNRDRDPLFADNDLPYPISVGQVRAGDWASSVPDWLAAEGRLGVRLGEDPQDARTAFEQALAEAATQDPWLRDHPPAVSWPGGQYASGRIDPDHPFVAELGRAVQDVTGQATPAPVAAPYGSDLRLYSGIGGIPTLHYGPGDVRMAHAPREQVAVDELVEVTRALIALAMRQCGAHR